MRQYYILAIPQTLRPLVETGKLPSSNNAAEQNVIHCYENYKDCLSNTTTNLHQSFLLCINLSKPLTKEMTIQHLEPSSIHCVYVYSERSKKTLHNLLKGLLSINVILAPELYLQPKIRSGDIQNSTMQTLTNTVNCVGVMGKGISLAFKKKYPEMFKDYKTRCDQGKVQLGEPYIYKLEKDKWIINFPTKNHWKKNSNLKDIENGLIFLASHLKSWGVTSLAVPPFGCTNGGLNWDDVFPLIKKYLYPVGIPLEIYTPANLFETKGEDTIPSKKNPLDKRDIDKPTKNSKDSKISNNNNSSTDFFSKKRKFSETITPTTENTQKSSKKLKPAPNVP